MIWTGKRHLAIQDLHERYGKIVRTGSSWNLVISLQGFDKCCHMLGPNTLSINSHTAIGPVYSSAQAFSKSQAYIPGKFHGDGLFFIRPRDVHNTRRKHWAPAFTPASVAKYKPIIEKRTNQLMGIIGKRKSGPYGSVDLSEAIQHWSFDVMGELTFGGANRLVCFVLCSVSCKSWSYGIPIIGTDEG